MRIMDEADMAVASKEAGKIPKESRSKNVNCTQSHQQLREGNHSTVLLLLCIIYARNFASC
jgi:hypothetical protein